jgi:phage minor structural protein
MVMNADNFITEGQVYVFDNYDVCVGVLGENLTTLHTKETTKNAADDSATIESYVFDENDPVLDILRPEHTYFIPLDQDTTTGFPEGMIYKGKKAYYNEDGGNDVAGVECMSSLIELLDEPVLWLPISNQTPSAALQMLIDHEIPSRFEIGYIDPRLQEAYGLVTTTSLTDQSKTNKLNFLVAMVKLYGGELSCRALYDPATGRLKRQINWYYKRGYDRGKLLMLEKDMKSVNVTIDTSNIITRVYGYGKEKDGKSLTFAASNGGLTYIESPAGAARYEWCDRNANGAIRHKAFVLYEKDEENMDAVSGLMFKASSILSKCGDPAISIKANIANLATYNRGIINGTAQIALGEFSPEPWYIGDYVSIFTKRAVKFVQGVGSLIDPNGVILSRVVEYERDHLNPQDTNVTIESTCAGITDDISQNEKKIDYTNYLVVWDGPNPYYAKISNDQLPSKE